MSRIILKNCSLAVGGELKREVSLRLVDGLIDGYVDRGFEDGEVVDCSSLTILPGFIDIHIHGASGIDVNAADADGLIEIARFLGSSGVTAWVPTLVPDSDENYRRVITAIDRLMEIQRAEPIAQAVGVHYEGVFANEHMCGALRPAYFKGFTGEEVAALPKLNSGIHMMTLAPEIEGGIDLVRELHRQGWIASIGHTHADVETLNAAFDAGARHMTHFFNAMTGVHHRDIGVAGWGLSRADVTFDIIADGIHVVPTMLEFACRSKTPDRVSLISDSIAPTGQGDGKYQIWDETVVVENGRTRNERGSIAGSVITMHDAARRMLSLGFSHGEVSSMASANPARLLGIDDSRGSIETGKRADLVGLNADGDLQLVIAGGKILRAPAAN